MASPEATGSARLRVVVVGAGLGGLAAAIALRRAGHEVVVVEQADALGTVGAGIQMAPNASRLLDSWGVVERFAGVGVPAQAAVRRSWSDGEILGEVEMGDALLESVGASYWCLHRADLHSALVGAATDPDDPGPPAEIRLDAPATAVVSTGPDEAIVEAGGEEVRGDLVIGADGIRSVVRTDLFGPESPWFSGRVTNRHVLDAALIRADEELAELIARPAQNIWLGPNGHVITHPIKGGNGLYMGVTRAGLEPDEAFWSLPVDPVELKAQIAGWDDRIHRLIDLAPTITAYGLHDSEPMDAWSVGRVGLLGDACHAMLPFQAQGAAQAIEDGAGLAVALREHGDDVAAALRRYEEMRKPRVTRVQEASRANAALWHLQEGPEQARRDEELKSGSGDFKSYQWLWAPTGDLTGT
ncbi:MAG: FAD-dependent monooxygenase [Actinobacteria bacterium]|nr:FAD-dependent monooxygenase [Actinomycetota bacterium]